jgi:hypothetical protein
VTSLFDELLSRARSGGAKKRVTVFVGDDDANDLDVAEQFARHDVHVEYRTLPSGAPEPFVVVENDDEFVGTIALVDFEGLLEPPAVSPDETTDASTSYRALFELLENTVFSAMTRRELLAVSREIEERAYRIGKGTLRVGFQSLSAFKPQTERYRVLATETDLDVHVYGHRDWAAPSIRGVSYHDYADADGERFWVMAYLTPDTSTANALLAHQDEDSYDGFWTDDPEWVREVAAALRGG